LNRIDEIIMFTPLGKEQVRGIVMLQLRILGQRLSQQDIHLKVTPDVMSYLSEKGFDPQYGARPVKRVVQKEVLNEMSRYLLAGKLDKSLPLVMDVFDGQVVFRKEVPDEILISLE